MRSSAARRIRNSQGGEQQERIAAGGDAMPGPHYLGGRHRHPRGELGHALRKGDDLRRRRIIRSVR